MSLELAKTVGKQLSAGGLTLAVAESCTGGLMASSITDVPGSSAYFRGGVIAYANFAKEQLLSVPGGLIASRGAVSREVALAMARGARHLLEADIALSATGIIGPGGGTVAKPVGLVFIALAADGHEECREFRWEGTRLHNKRRSVDAALSLLLEYLRSEGGAV